MDNSSIEQIHKKPSKIWYIIAFIVPLIGGILGYLNVRKSDPRMATNLLVVSFIGFLAISVAVYRPSPSEPVTQQPPNDGKVSDQPKSVEKDKVIGLFIGGDSVSAGVVGLELEVRLEIHSSRAEVEVKKDIELSQDVTVASEVFGSGEKSIFFTPNEATVGRTKSYFVKINSDRIYDIQVQSTITTTQKKTIINTTTTINTTRITSTISDKPAAPSLETVKKKMFESMDVNGVKFEVIDAYSSYYRMKIARAKGVYVVVTVDFTTNRVVNENLVAQFELKDPFGNRYKESVRHHTVKDTQWVELTFDIPALRYLGTVLISDARFTLIAGDIEIDLGRPQTKRIGAYFESVSRAKDNKNGETFLEFKIGLINYDYTPYSIRSINATLFLDDVKIWILTVPKMKGDIVSDYIVIDKESVEFLLIDVPLKDTTMGETLSRISIEELNKINLRLEIEYSLYDDYLQKLLGRDVDLFSTFSLRTHE